MPDGSLQVFFKATPTQGPSYAVDKSCLGKETLCPSWIGAGGKLVKGLFHLEQDAPVTGEGQSGYDRTTSDMQLANP